MSDITFNPGVSVRIKTDPSRVGILTNKNKVKNGKTRHLVQFPDNPTWLLENALEIVNTDDNDVYSLLEKGRFGRVSDLRRNLTYIQLSGKLANLVYSMDTTNTEFYAYQYKPVLSFLDSPSKGLLVADEVGLGKTIEAGLIWTELRARFDSRRLLVICPAMLREKWKAELSFRFGIEGTLVNAQELLDEIKRPRYHYPPGRALICSYDGIRPPKANDDLDIKKTLSARDKLSIELARHAAQEPLFDLLIFDEAHKMRNPHSSTSNLGRLLRDVAEHILLLSATPINLKSDDLFHLLNIVDESTFSTKEVFPEILEANAPLIRAQKLCLSRDSLASDVSKYLEIAKESNLMRDNQQLANILLEMNKGIDFNEEANRILIANKIEKCNLLSKVVSRTKKSEVKELRVIREPFSPEIQMTDEEAIIYERVTQIVRRYAIDRDIHDGFLLASPQRQLSSSIYAAIYTWKNKVATNEEQLYEDFGVEKDMKPIGPLMYAINEGLSDITDISNLRTYDSKFSALKNMLQEILLNNKNEKLIIFSYFRGTLKYLSERLQAIGIRNELLMGGMKEPKQDIIERFKNTPDIKILLASEVASEGVDLQFCSILVNYDLPWNPMKIEQRIGRIDRHGQKASKIQIFNFCYKNTIDERIYTRLYERLEIFEHSLGDMEEILGEKINNLTRDLITKELTVEQEIKQIEQTSLAIENLRQQEKLLEEQASNLIAHSGHILQQVQAAHDFSRRITEIDLAIYVKDFLEKHTTGSTFVRTDDNKDIYDIKLTAACAAELQQFVLLKKMFGLTGLNNGSLTRCEFVNSVTKATNSLERINQTHPLIQYISAKLNQIDEAFISLVAIKLNKSDATAMPKGYYVAVVQRMSLEGIKLEEKLLAKVMALDSELTLDGETSLELINTLRIKADDWPSANAEVVENDIVEKIDECREHIDLQYHSEASQKKAENEDRVSLQVLSIQKHFERLTHARESALEKLYLKGNKGLINATKAQITALREKYELRKSDLEVSREFRYRLDDVCHIVLKIV